jgi:triphosphatase
VTDAPAGAGPSGDGVEVEWQFDALDLRPVERWLAALPAPAGTAVPGTPPVAGTSAVASPTVLAKPPRRLVDRYLDTADWRIARAGFVLRTRSRGRHDEVTLKDTRPPGPDGLRHRLEVSEPLPDGGVGALDDGGPVGRRLAAVAGRRPFRQVLEVRTRRRPYSLRVGDEEVAEVALDDTVITAGPGDQPVRLRRVEVEVVPARAGELGPLVDELRRSCGLQPATLSKFEAGLMALGIEVPGPPDLGPTDVTSRSSLGDLAFAVVRTHLGVLLAREPGTRLGEDVEELHDMRVASRRLRAAFDLFADALPVRAQAMRGELRWVAGVLGSVRDLDVQIGRLPEMEAWAPGAEGGRSPLEDLRDLLEAERAEARRDLVAALDSPRWERLAAGLVAMAQHGQRRRLPAARAAAALTVPDLVTPRHRAVVKAARRARRSGEPADFHRLRIRCKRLRYSLEFTAGIYGGRTERFTRRLARLQDSLGLLQDAEVATARLLDLATGTGGGPRRALPPRTVFAMGAVAERYRAESEALLASMPKRLGILDGDDWQSLAAHMARRQAAAGEGAPPRVPRPPARRQPFTDNGRPGPPEEAAAPAGGPGAGRPALPPGPVALPPVAGPSVVAAPPAAPGPVALPPVAGAGRTAVEPPPPAVAAGPAAAPAAEPSPAAAALSAWPAVAWGPPVEAPPRGTPAVEEPHDRGPAGEPFPERPYDDGPPTDG